MKTDVLRVLVLDDNPDDVGIVRRLLSQYRDVRFSVHMAQSTLQCQEKLRDEGADVLLIDYSLPGEDGLSFFRRMSDRTRLPPVILVTGQGSEQLAVESLQAGAQGYLPKSTMTPARLGESLLEACERFRRDEELSRFDDQIMIALAAAAEGKDPTTAGHLQRLAQGAMRLGQALGLAEQELHVLRYGALLHDIGKLAVPTAILRKPGPLMEEEWEEMRQHPLVGERICSCLWLAREVAPIIRHHHEHWDGSGYIDGLAGEEIPFMARAISVIDAYDAMVSDRPYRKALSLNDATERLKAGAGSQWDPDIVGMFLRLVQSGEIGSGASRHVKTA